VLRDAAPRAVYLVARSQGSEALAVSPEIGAIEGLKGRVIAVPTPSPERYFELFELARVGLGPHDVRTLPVSDSSAAAKALRESRAQAAVGFTAEMTLAAHDRGGKILATTSDAPHLTELVLVVRGDWLARYPEAVRRLVRGTAEACESVRRDSMEAARLLDTTAPGVGDPEAAIKDEPPATQVENAGFFGLSRDAPIHFDELIGSASALGQKLGEESIKLDPSEVRDLMALRALAASRVEGASN
jgi:ABC-type nitrate/sulfonate/bicarbonate transport system substrate-binding protein